MIAPAVFRQAEADGLVEPRDPTPDAAGYTPSASGAAAAFDRVFVAAELSPVQSADVPTPR